MLDQTESIGYTYPVTGKRSIELKNNTRTTPYKIKPRWKKGESGNPNGRPKKDICIPDILREIGDTMAKDKSGNPIMDEQTGKPLTLQRFMLRQVYMMAAKGDMDAVKYISERTEGKTATPIEMSDGTKREIVEELVIVEGIVNGQADNPAAPEAT